MRFFLFGTVLILHLGNHVLGGETYARYRTDIWEESFSSLVLERAELQELVDRALERYPAVSAEMMAPRVRMNFQFIYRNNLNRDHFVVAPAAESVVSQIKSIFDLSEKLDDLVRTGREFQGQEQQNEQYNKLVREVGKTAEQLRGAFKKFFVEGTGTSSYRFAYPKVQPVSVQFTHFIIQCDKINKDLGERLREFFFGSSPSSVAVADYKKNSIIVLTECLQKLSRLADQWIRDSDDFK